MRRLISQLRPAVSRSSSSLWPFEGFPKPSVGLRNDFVAGGTGVTDWTPMPSRRFTSSPTSSSRSRDRLIVVLDMDECLIHSTNFNDGSGSHRQHENSRPDEVKLHPEVETFLLNFEGGSTCRVHKRPGVDDFLAACTAQFDTYVFTAGTQVYADPLLDKLDPTRSLKGRFYRTDCRQVQVPVAGGSFATQFLKDLSVVACDEQSLARCVLVDNNPISFVCQPSNGIPVPDFVGVPDQILPSVLKLLMQLKTLSDVRPALARMFELDKNLADARAQLLANDVRSRL